MLHLTSAPEASCTTSLLHPLQRMYNPLALAYCLSHRHLSPRCTKRRSRNRRSCHISHSHSHSRSCRSCRLSPRCHLSMHLMVGALALTPTTLTCIRLLPHVRTSLCRILYQVMLSLSHAAPADPTLGNVAHAMRIALSLKQA